MQAEDRTGPVLRPPTVLAAAWTMSTKSSSVSKRAEQVIPLTVCPPSSTQFSADDETAKEKPRRARSKSLNFICVKRRKKEQIRIVVMLDL